MLGITVILFLAGQAASCQGPDVTADACIEAVLLSLQIGFKVDFYFYQVCFLPTDYFL